MKMTHPDTDLDIDVPEHLADTYRSQGWREATTDAPKGNASLEEWQEYARAKGFAEEQIEGQSRDDLRAALS